jgi:hypothetical protein
MTMTLSDIGQAFKDNVIIRRLKSGRYRARCRKGLWSVEGPDAGPILDEALHYFQQYYEDGEYALPEEPTP